MKKLGLISFIALCVANVYAQDIPPVTEQQMEDLTSAEESETEDDSYFLLLDQYKKHPIDLNTAENAELKELSLLNALQIESLISYRDLLGKLISIYELQAIPYWDPGTIRKLLPFVTITSAISIKEDLHRRMKEGDHSLLLRISQTLEKPDTEFLGSPQRVFFRYRYVYKNLLQFGITGDKDAGEQFFKGAQGKGFDFYSFHLFTRNIGIVSSLAIGDFTVSMGQGLIQWQSMGFKRSADAIAIKRQSPVLRPYASAGEFNFQRGIGLTMRKRKWEATVFLSRRRLNAGIDTSGGDESISSFLASGYNRTESEITHRNDLRQTTMGSVIRYRHRRFGIALNDVFYAFSLPVKKSDEPYNLFALAGKKWFNASADYNYTWRNLHFFGEAAIDRNLHKAFVNGLLLSPDQRVDLSFLYRRLDEEYQSLNANAFTENTSPSNERGLYAGITVRPVMGWRFDAYADLCQFPWLKYLIDAPAQSKDFLMQLNYTPGRQAELFLRYRTESKQIDENNYLTAIKFLVPVIRKNCRFQVNYKINPAITFRQRLDMVWYSKNENTNSGFLAFVDMVYKPSMRPYSVVCRGEYFETDNYDSRIYTYENDVLYSSSIPAFSGKGYRYYVIINHDFGRKASAWLRYSQIIHGEDIVTGPSQPDGKRAEVKLQFLYSFRP